MLQTARHYTHHAHHYDRRGRVGVSACVCVMELVVGSVTYGGVHEAQEEHGAQGGRLGKAPTHHQVQAVAQATQLHRKQR